LFFSNQAMPSDAVTIVSGLPRSGTSMMMRMVEAGGLPALTDGVRAADADNPLGYYEFEPVKRTSQDPSWLDRARGRVVKMVHLLLMDLPGGYVYRVILMRRDPDEVIRSQRKMLERAGRPSGDPAALKRVFAAQMDTVRRWLDAQPHICCLDVSYNAMIAGPEAEARRVAEFLGLTDRAAMIAAVDPALYRNRAVSPI
jgi:Sulfotransferase family